MKIPGVFKTEEKAGQFEWKIIFSLFARALARWYNKSPSNPKHRMCDSYALFLFLNWTRHRNRAKKSKRSSCVSVHFRDISYRLNNTSHSDYCTLLFVIVIRIKYYIFQFLDVLHFALNVENVQNAIVIACVCACLFARSSVCLCACAYEVKCKCAGLVDAEFIFVCLQIVFFAASRVHDYSQEWNSSSHENRS